MPVESNTGRGATRNLTPTRFNLQERSTEGDWLDQEINYTYSGSVIESLNLVNSGLISLRALGYELPLHVENPLAVTDPALVD